MPGRLILALALAAIASTAASAQPNFTASRGEVAPAAPYAGAVVRHVFTVTNTGTPATYVSVSSSLRRGFLISAEGDCASAKFDDSGNLAWHSGRFDSGATRRCTLTVLTRRNAAGTLANVITDIRVIPSGFLRVRLRPVGDRCHRVPRVVRCRCDNYRIVDSPDRVAEFSCCVKSATFLGIDNCSAIDSVALAPQTPPRDALRLDGWLAEWMNA